jgi:hypothetical protein
MSFSKLLIVIFVSWCVTPSIAAECTAYEKSHPAFLLDGAHLSTGKCQTCASCHINSIFNGTPRSCVTCHNGDPARNTIGRPALHIPTQLIECNVCHKTVSFATSVTMNHVALGAVKCTTCHSTSSPRYLGNQQRMSLTHDQRTPVPTDCSMAGCHRPLGTKGVLYKSWDN